MARFTDYASGLLGLGALFIGAYGLFYNGDNDSVPTWSLILAALLGGAAFLLSRKKEATPEPEPKAADDKKVEREEVKAEQPQDQGVGQKTGVQRGTSGQEQSRGLSARYVREPTPQDVKDSRRPVEVGLNARYLRQFGFLDNFSGLGKFLKGKIDVYETACRNETLNPALIFSLYDEGILRIIKNLESNFGNFYEKEVEPEENGKRFIKNRSDFLRDLNARIRNLREVYEETKEGLERIKDFPGRKWRQLGEYLNGANQLVDQAVRYTITKLTKQQEYSNGIFTRDSAKTLGLYDQAIEKLTGNKGSLRAYINGVLRDRSLRATDRIVAALVRANS